MCLSGSRTLSARQSLGVKKALAQGSNDPLVRSAMNHSDRKKVLGLCIKCQFLRQRPLFFLVLRKNIPCAKFWSVGCQILQKDIEASIFFCTPLLLAMYPVLNSQEQGEFYELACSFFHKFANSEVVADPHGLCARSIDLFIRIKIFSMYGVLINF